MARTPPRRAVARATAWPSRAFARATAWPSRAVARATAWLACGFASALPAAAQAPDLAALFAPGARWSWSASAAAPWIPRSVAFAAGGELALAGPALANPALAVLSGAGQASGTPLAQAALAGAAGVVQVEGGPGIDDAFALAQFPSPDSAHKATRVMRFPSGSAAAGFGPSWTHDLELVSSGGALLAVDCQGLALVAAAHDAEHGRVRVDWIERQSGALLLRTEVEGLSLKRLAVAAGGGRVAIAAGLDVWVLDGAGLRLHHEVTSSTAEALALSDDGQTLAIGGFGETRILSEQGGAYVPSWTVVGSPGEMAVRAALSGDGATLALGWWDFQSGSAFRCEARDGTSHAQLLEVTQFGGALQNYPEAVAVSADGRRIAFGVWGQQTGAPDAWLFDRDSAAPLIAADLGGSVQALALDATGTRLLVAFKHAHANQFASTGTVRLFDTGERDLQVRSAPELGGVLSLAAESPGAAAAWFGIGFEGALLAVPGLDGELWLDPAQILLVLGAPCDAAGRALVEIPIPQAPALIGLPLAAQALFVGGNAAAFMGGFSSWIARPAIL